MTSTLNIQTPVGQLVADRPALARVFSQFNIDFCCGGKRSLETACHRQGLSPHVVLQAIRDHDQADRDHAQAPAPDPAQMTLSELCDHIESTHHAYLRETLPRLHTMIAKVVAAHGERYPWMREVFDIFEPFANELTQHMLKEEQGLFPMIRQLEFHQPPCPIASVIQMLEQEHDHAGDALKRFCELTDHYTPPANACNTFRAVLYELAQLEQDMHQHVHKENNILFLRTVDLEKHHS